MTQFDQFMEHFRSWVADACQEWSYPDPDDEFYAGVIDRLGEGILSWIGVGLQKAIVKPEGLRFNVAGASCTRVPTNGSAAGALPNLRR